MYYFNDLRVPKDANLQLALLARTLGVVIDILETGRPGAQMPVHLVVHSDNASGEGKNQTVMKLCGWLVWRGMFETVTVTSSGWATHTTYRANVSSWLPAP